MSANNPLKVAKMLTSIEEEAKNGVFIIDIDEPADIIKKTSLIMKEFFDYQDGRFYDLIGSNPTFENVPDDLSFERAEEHSTNLILGPVNEREKISRKFIYKKEGNNKVRAQLRAVIDGKEPDDQYLSYTTQNTFSIIASVLAIPILAIASDRKKIGILFDGSTIEIDNWNVTFDYLDKISKENSLTIFLYILSGRIGSNSEMFCNTVNRVGTFSSGKFIKINAYSRSVDIIRDMVSSYNSMTPRMPLLLFMGAGCSIEAKIPPTEQLMEQAMKRLINIPQESTIEIEILKERFKQERIISRGNVLSDEEPDKIRITFERIMTEELRGKTLMSESPTLQKLKEINLNTRPSAAHIDLAEQVKQGYKIIFLTTNYDDLIEQALGTNNCEIFAKEKDFAHAINYIKGYLTGTQSKVPILKFHGTINNFQSIKASVNHTTALEPHKHETLMSLLDGRICREAFPNCDQEQISIKSIFLGYGFHDRDIYSILSSAATSQDCCMNAFVVNPTPSSGIMEFLRLAHKTEEFDGYMDHLISIPFARFVNCFLGKT